MEPLAPHATLRDTVVASKQGQPEGEKTMIDAEAIRTNNRFSMECDALERAITRETLRAVERGESSASVQGFYTRFSVRSMELALSNCGYEVNVVELDRMVTEFEGSRNVTVLDARIEFSW